MPVEAVSIIVLILILAYYTKKEIKRVELQYMSMYECVVAVSTVVVIINCF